jgi:hypothetical protein
MAHVEAIGPLLDGPLVPGEVFGELRDAPGGRPHLVAPARIPSMSPPDQYIS